MSNSSFVPVARVPRFLFMNAREWAWCLLATTIAVGACWPLYGHHSTWAGAAVGLFVFSAMHLVYAGRYCLPLPQLAIMLATIYFGISPLVSLYFPSEDPLYRIRRDPSLYFNYAVPAVLATAFGWYIAIAGARPLIINRSALRLPVRVFHCFDACIVAGTTLSLVSTYVVIPSSIAFLLLLITNLRFVGILGWVIAANAGWKWRVALMLLMELYFSAATGFFLDLALWTLSITMVLFYRFGISRPVVFAMVIIGVFMAPCVQRAKWDYRRVVWDTTVGEKSIEIFGNKMILTPLSKPVAIMGKIVESAIKLVTFETESDFWGDTIRRYNQGWIVERVMVQVPNYVPYAEGETVQRAVIDSFIPRFLFPGKTQAGGAENFTRYTGLILNSNTSMNLGFVGEMYANFGPWWGVVGCGGYGFFLGIVFRWLVSRTYINVLYIAFIPYVMHWAVLGEVGLFEVCNYTIKAIVVMLGVEYILRSMLTHNDVMAVSERHAMR